MPKSRITSKGRVTIPLPIRRRLGVRPGDEIEFVEEPAGVRLRKIAKDSPFTEWRGFLKHLAGQDPDALIEEMRGR